MTSLTFLPIRNISTNAQTTLRPVVWLSGSLPFLPFPVLYFEQGILFFQEVLKALPLKVEHLVEFRFVEKAYAAFGGILRLSTAGYQPQIDVLAFYSLHACLAIHSALYPIPQYQWVAQSSNRGIPDSSFR